MPEDPCVIVRPLGKRLIEKSGAVLTKTVTVVDTVFMSFPLK